MPSVGTAYVNVRVSTAGFEDSLKKMLAGISTKMEKAGTDAGKSFERGLNKSDPFKPLVDSSNKAATDVDKSLRKISDSGDKMSSSISDSSRRAGSELQGLVDNFGDVDRAAREAGRSSGRAARGIEQAGSAGGRAGSGFRSGGDGAGFFSRHLKELVDEAPKGTALLQTLFRTAAFGGTAITGLVGGLSSAAQGIFAIGANAAAAAPALAIMANGLLSLGQVGAVAAISMQGVGNALTAGFAAADKAALSAGTSATGAGKAVGGMAKATEGAARAVRDAKQGLQDAYRESARAAEDAAQRVADAEHALAQAQRDSAIAQRALNDARQEGIEQMEDIAFAAEEAGLAEEHAKLDLADAQQKLIETSELAPDDRARVEAELAFKEAELHMREAIDRREDADKAQKKSVKEGIDGTDAMKDAHNDVADAQQAEADAERDLADARKEAARTAEDSARRIADAQQAVADAQKSLADAQKGLGAAGKTGAAGVTALATAQDKYAQALAKLSPSQQEFVKRIIGMRSGYEAFQRKIGQPLFAQLNTSLDELNDKGKDGKTILDVLTTGLEGTSVALGNTARKAAELAADDVFQASFADAMDSNNEAMGNFGDAGVHLADAFIQVADAAGPLFVKFSEWVADVTDGWAETARLNNTLQNTGDKVTPLTEKINNAGKRVKEFWNLAKQLWKTLSILGGAANQAALEFDGLGDKSGKAQGFIPFLTHNLKQFNKELKDNPNLVSDFDQSLQNIVAIGDAIGTVIQPIIDLGHDPQVETAFQNIADSDAFKRLGDTAGDALPELSLLVTNIADILANLSESGAIDHFLDWLVKATDFAGVFAQKLNDWHILKITGYITGATAAITLMWGAIKIISSPFVRMSTGFAGFMSKVKTAKASGKGLGGSLLAGFKKPVSAGGVSGTAEDVKLYGVIETAAASIVTAIDACCARMVLAMEAGGAAGAGGELLGAAPRAGGGAAAGAGMLGAGAIMPAGEVGKVSKFAGIMGKFGKVLGPATKLMKPLSFGIRALGAAFRFALGPVGLIVLTLLPLLWPLLVKLEEKTGIFSKTLDVLVDAFGWLWDILKKVFNWVKDNWPTLLIILTGPIGIAVALIVKYWDKIWDGIKAVFGWFKANWPLILGIITGPIGLAVVLVIKYWDQILDFLKAVPGKIASFFSGMWDGMVNALQAAWDWVKGVWANIVDWVKGRPEQFTNNLRALWNIFSEGLRIVWDKVKSIWNRIVDWVKGRPKQFVQNLRLLWDIFRTALSKAWTAVKSIWTRVTTWVKGRPAQFKQNLSALWDVFKDKLDDAWTAIQTKWTNIKTAVGNWPGQLTTKLAGLWDGLKNGLKDAWDSVADAINKYVIGGINSVLGKFGVDPVKLSVPHITFAAQGGPIRGPGGPTADRVPAMLSNGEYVLPTRSARKLGPKLLEHLRRYGELPNIGGFLSGAAHAFGSAVGALKDGPAAAAKWIIGKAVEHIGGSGWISDAAIGAFKKSIDKIIDWVKGKEPVAVKGVAVSASGWTYPLTHRVIITQYPNPGHNPSNSVDLGAPMYTGVRAASAGIAYRHTAYGYGNYMTVSHAGGVSTLYAHLASYKVASGSKVLAGQIIALSDSTGAHTSGPHLHFELNPSSNTVTAMAARGVKLGQGGVVAASPEGTLALLAEAGQHERVTPLDSEGFTPAERRILESLESQFTGGGDTIHVHPSQKMNETALADLVARRVAWKRRRGGGFR